MRLLSAIALPAVWLLSVFTSFLVKILGLKGHDNNVTEDEIKSLIQDGADAGEVKKVEQDIMERALVLGDLRVASIMTPKVDVKALNLDMDVAEIKRHLSENLHNSYPVYCNSRQETVCGMVSLKQLILTIDRPGFRLQDVVSAPVYFPETMSVYDALDTFFGCGAKEVHARISCPPLVYGCPFIGFTSSKSDMELITRQIIKDFEGDDKANLELYATAGTPQYERMVKEIANRLGLTPVQRASGYGGKYRIAEMPCLHPLFRRLGLPSR
jgi:Mg2+/Co2+ transporter CorC